MTKFLHWVLKRANSYKLLHYLIKLGFADAHVEGGIVFWRWDFWNSNHKRWLNEWSRE